MNTVEIGWGRKILIFTAVICSLILIINFLLNYLINYVVSSYIIPQSNNNQKQLELMTSIRVFPSTTISIYDLKFDQDNKNIC